MDSHFTFLTSTNPALREADIKQMRAHVTRKNFEKRRERLEGSTTGLKKARHMRHRQQESSDKLRLARNRNSSSDESEFGQQYRVSPYHSMIPTEANYAAIYQCKL